MARVEGENLILENGRLLYCAAGGILGMSLQGEPEITHGFDDGFDWDYDDDADPFDRPLSPEERVEIADFMIERWREFKGRQGTKQRCVMDGALTARGYYSYEDLFAKMDEGWKVVSIAWATLDRYGDKIRTVLLERDL